MKNKYITLLLIMAVIAGAFFYYGSDIINSKSRRINAYDRRIKEEQEKLNSAKVLNDQLSEVSKVILASITEEREYSSEEINAFVKRLADLADKNEITVDNLVPKVVSGVDRHYVEQQYTLELNCTFVQLGNFLAQLEGFDNIMEVNTLSVNPVTSNQKSDQLAETRYRVTMLLTTVKIVKEA
ncbi:MAG: type 4a pilus biogenesis protein PilO [Candidatus Cloacimonadales bacterium]